jgi:thiamine-monophosphate kinase
LEGHRKMASLDPDEKISWLAAVLTAPLRPPHKLVAGIGEDDCAIIDFAPSSILVVTSDYVNANPIMLTLGIGTYYDMGRYLLNSNLADLCGSGAEPVAALVSIMWDRARAESDFEELIGGVQDAASYAGIAIVGGDTKLSSRPAYCATAIGTAKNRSHLFIKNRARPGDGVWVSGSLGSCAAGLYGWDEMSEDPAWLEWARRVVGDPPLPLDLARQASALAMEASGTDLSDGLGSDLASLCDVSEVGAEIVADALPLDTHVTPLAARLGVPP